MYGEHTSLKGCLILLEPKIFVLDMTPEPFLHLACVNSVAPAPGRAAKVLFCSVLFCSVLCVRQWMGQHKNKLDEFIEGVSK